MDASGTRTIDDSPATAPADLLWRVGALVAAAATMLLANQAALRTSAFDNGVRGDLLSWLDIGAAILLVLTGVLLGRPWVEAHLSGRPAPVVRIWWSQLARMVVPLWLICALVSLAIVKPAAGPRQIALTLVMFRDPRQLGPLPGTSIGWLLFVGLCVAVLLPAWSRLIRSLPGGSPAERLRREVSGCGRLIFIATMVRVLAMASDRTAPFGILSHLPGQVDLIAIGMLIAGVSAADRAILPRWLVSLAGAPVVSALGACVVWLASALVVGAPAVGAEAGFAEVVGRHWLQAVAAGLLVFAVCSGGASARGASVRRVGRPIIAAALAAPGILLLGEPLVDLVARQYRERVSDLGGTRFLTGPATPPFVWAFLLAASAGLVISAALALRRRRWPTGIDPFTVSLAGVTAGAFLWRFVALLTIAPERTDGGDPLFYHTTANLLAEGRGFPEPLNWIAFGKVIPSAIHGPLYPMVLSISSRLGGHTYFDHKMVSLLIGTGTVATVALVGRRLAGGRVGIVAAVLAALYPNLWTIDTLLFPEGLFAVLTTLVILVAYRWRDDHRLIWAAALGALIGLSALARGEGIALAILLAVPWMLGDRTIPSAVRWRHLLTSGLVCLATLLPWTIRNMERFDVFVPLSTNGQELLVYANCDETYSGKFLGFWLFDCQDQIRAEIGGDPPGDEAEKAAYWGDRGRQYAREHVGELPKVVAARIGRQWELFRPIQNTEFAPIEGRSAGWAKVGLGYYYALAGLSIAGFVSLRRRGRALLPLVAQIVSVTLTAAYAYGNTRFRASAEPVLCILAAVALVPLLGRFGAWLRQLSNATIGQPLADPEAFVLGGGGGLRRAGAWRQWIELAVLAVGIGVPLRGMYLSSGATMEEGFMLTFPERVLAGDIPNVDFLHLYGPGSLHALAGVYRIFGVDLFVQRTYGLAQHVGIILGIYALLRVWGRLAALGGALLAMFLVLAPIGLSALAWNGAVALGLWSVVFALRARAPATVRPGRCWIVAGVLAGVTLTFRPDLVVALALAHGFLLWRSGHLRRFVAAAAVGLVPFVVHVALAGPTAVLDGMFLDPVRYLRPGRTLPQPPSWDHFDGALQVIADKFPPWWEIPHLAGPKQLFLWFFTLPLVAVGVLATGALLRRRLSVGSGARRRLDVLVAAGLFGVGLLPQAFQRPDSAHFAWVGCVCFPIAVAAVIEVIAARRPGVSPVRRSLWGVLAVAMSFIVIFPFFSYRPYLAYARQSIGDLPPGGLKVERNGRAFYLGDTRPWSAARQVVEDLDAQAKPGERLLVGPVDLRQTIYSDVFFYYLFPELTPATYYIEMDPGLANAEGTRLTGDVESADWLILTRYWSGWIEPNTSTVFGDDRPNQAVETSFCLRGSYENDLIRLYQRCPVGDGIGPYEGPYEPTFDYAVEVSVPVPARPDGTSPFSPGPFQPFVGG